MCKHRRRTHASVSISVVCPPTALVCSFFFRFFPSHCLPVRAQASLVSLWRVSEFLSFHFQRCSERTHWARGMAHCPSGSSREHQRRFPFIEAETSSLLRAHRFVSET